MNWVEQIIKNGFIKINFIKEEYYPNQHWYGVSKYNPDVRLLKENKEVLLSYSGTFMAMAVNQRGMNSFSEEEQVLIKNCNSRYVCISDGRGVLYETFSGVEPPYEIINKLIENEL